MHQVPPEVWNRIAETQPLETEWAQQMFPLPGDLMDKALERESAELKKAGNPAPVVAAFHRLAPLVWESEAIAAFVREEPNAAGALPNVVDADEAVMLASMDSALTASEQKQLRQLLTTHTA
jgi:hypothetical protein